MITFIVKETDHVDETFECNATETLLDLKKKIIAHYHLNCKYIDIISNVERPIRVMGKFNFDKGLQPRTLDNYQFNRFGIDERTIPITFEEENDVVPFVKKSTVKNGTASKYVPPNGQSLKEEDPVFNINSKLDFPSL